jgi:hypothetical protein
MKTDFGLSPRSFSMSLMEASFKVSVRRRFFGDFLATFM